MPQWGCSRPSQPQYITRYSKFTNVEAIFTTLKTVYDDIDSAATAQKEIYEVKQGQKPLASFLPNWIAVAKLKIGRAHV